ncbi:MAG: tetratricopeptide repeat protein [Candidatus Riflebacteria bacterium]|jgi:tetratricopeptide (TPR) repeat protein|nr:tetratricopeptide repeat protein [Candidatus Riflebacteria bacterium]
MTETNRFMEAEQYMESCLSLFLMNKTEQALKVIEKAIECDPNFAEAYNKKGDCLLKLGRIEEALKCYLKSQELNPNIQNNYYDLGRTYLLLGDYTNSLANFKKAYDMKPQDDIHAFIGKIYFDQNMIDEAKQSFENLLIGNSSDPKDSIKNELKATNSNTMANYYYAQILQRIGKDDEAKQYFNRIIEKYSRLVRSKPDLAEGYYYIGKCSYYIGDDEKAEENLKLAIKYDTDAISNHYSFDMFYSDAEAFAALAEIQARRGKSSEAKENILKALALEPNNKKLQETKMKLGF